MIIKISLLCWEWHSQENFQDIRILDCKYLRSLFWHFLSNSIFLKTYARSFLCKCVTVEVKKILDVGKKLTPRLYFSGDSRILGVNFGRERVLFAKIFTVHDLFSTAKFHALLNHLRIQDQTQNLKPQSKWSSNMQDQSSWTPSRYLTWYFGRLSLLAPVITSKTWIKII